MVSVVLSTKTTTVLRLVIEASADGQDTGPLFWLVRSLNDSYQRLVLKQQQRLGGVFFFYSSFGSFHGTIFSATQKKLPLIGINR